MLNLLRKNNDLSRQATIWNIHLPKLEDNPFQTRQVNDPDHVLGLAASIAQMAATLPDTKGLQQLPVGRLVRYSDGKVAGTDIYEDPDMLAELLTGGEHVVELAFGHSRRLAFLVLANGPLHVFKKLDAQHAADWRMTMQQYDAGDYTSMPVLLRPLSDREMWEHAITENAQRRDLTAIEEATAIERARKDLGMTYDEAGRIFGKSRGAAANLVRLLQLPGEYQSAILEGKLTERHGRELLRLAVAQHLYHDLPAGRLATFTVKELALELDRTIAGCQPIAPAQRTGYRRPKWNDQVAVAYYDPPAWPLDWTPDQPNEHILGPCTGCDYLARFGGDAGPRCTQPASKTSAASCVNVKDRQYQAQQAQAQQAAINERVKSDSTRPPQTAGGPPVLDIPIPGAAMNLARVPIATDVDLNDITWFSTSVRYSSAPAGLIDKGLCNGDRCPCFVVAYNNHPDTCHVRLDPVGAPNMCAGCTSKQRLANRRQEMEHGDLAEYRKRVRTEQQEAERLLGEFYDSLTASDIWDNKIFLASLITSIVHVENRHHANQWDLVTLQRKLWMSVAAGKCQTWQNSKMAWDMDRVQGWIADQCCHLGRSLTPIIDIPPIDNLVTPVVYAVEPDRQDANWTGDDEASYQCLMMEWDGASWASLAGLIRDSAGGNGPCQVNPNVIRRLAKECPLPAIAAGMYMAADELSGVLA